MRAQKSGTIANLGSIGGWSGLPAAGLYCATKAAIAIYTEAVREELAGFGIETTCIEPGYFRTNVLANNGRHKLRTQKYIAELDEVMLPIQSGFASLNQHQPGDPVKGARVIVEALTRTGRCQGRSLPPRLALGRDAVQEIGASLDRMREGLELWKDVVTMTDCDDV